MIKVITPTGARPEAIENLNHYLEQQTEQNFKWIVLDDCEPRIKKPSRCDLLIHPDWVWNGENTQSKSLLKLINECSFEDKIIVCEDDDYYHPDYIKTVSKKLDKYNLVGDANTVYYNVSNNTYTNMNCKRHASLFQTAFTGRLISHFKKVCRENKTLIDSKLWAIGGYLYRDNKSLGIKGMTGRTGIGVGHKLVGKSDLNREFLKSFIGENEQRY